ncbi:MAG TPA: hypothetical protein VGR27_04010, partial [Longimicrobiaceae bacterium]|nr:hypothetical protein [Longimicrobiaceae bacterium]
DVYAALPAITGKMELEYEGEMQGAEAIGRDLIAAAAREIFDRHWDPDDLEEVIGYFDGGGVLQISDTAGADVSWQGLRRVPGLLDALRGTELYDADDDTLTVAGAELLLEGLAGHRRISRAESGAFSRARPERPRKGQGGAGGLGGGPFGKDIFG